MPLIMKPASAIKVRLGIEAGGPAQKFFCNECYRYMSPFVPGGMKSHLNQNVVLASDGSSVMYLSPGATYLYYGNLFIDPKYKVGAFPIRGGKISFNEADGPIEGFVSRKGIPKLQTTKELTYHTPGTGAKWDELMLTSRGDELVDSVQKFVERGCK